MYRAFLLAEAAVSFVAQPGRWLQCAGSVEQLIRLLPLSRPGKLTGTPATVATT
jgi:hypothetical protein